ncbi:tyrosine-type recombinase/integrase [Endozoicomonas euniceicola]|uniref:Tyrosine-type recombinase/integrase n=1 Tax=Endozoicomonas euniceicola TaxID=1234143 RepID=A0ABY6GMU5_9GAMM|nr:tyrosine-type recombinase/integrase [Endozoicomonas euniceicola]UYM14054.1 tyrosine-type recombinase/integrase [Endozoicomonas euniceicola]
MPAKKLTDSLVSKTTARLTDSAVRGFFVLPRKTGKFFYYKYKTPEGKSRSFPLGRFGNVTTTEARKLAKEAAGQVAKGLDPQAEKQAHRAEQKRQEQETLRAFLAGGYREVTPKKTADEVTPKLMHHFSEYMDQPMSSITAWSIEKWKRSYPGKPSGANRMLTRLRGVLNKAVKAGLLEVSPMADVKKLKEDKNQKIRYLTTVEEKTFLDAVEARQEKHREERTRYIKWCMDRNRKPPMPFDQPFTDHVAPMIVVKLNTGLRRGELFNLRVADLNLPDRLLTVVGEGAKSGQTRQIPLNDKAFTALVGWLNQTGNSGLVFPSPVTGLRLDNINSAWRQLRKGAGLPDLRLHDLRHTFGTRLAHNRVDLVTIKELMGHESLDTTARYLHTSQELKINAVMGLV